MSTDAAARSAPTRLARLVTGGLAAASFGMGVLVAADGTVGWRLVRVAAVLVLALLCHAAHRRNRILPTLLCGMVVLATSVGFLPHRAGSLSLLGIAAPATAAASLALVVMATIGVVERRRLLGRVGGVAGSLVALLVVASVVTPAVVATNVAERPIGDTPATRGLEYEDVWMVAGDGTRLAGWYVPSTNRAAVILRHGAGSTRSSVLDQAGVLARHGYGVLLTDARGHGESQGRAMDFGWNGDTDIAAATAFLASRPEVDPDRIGIVGLSMGGEEAIGAAGSNHLLRAVVAEGATARTAGDKTWLEDRYGLRGRLQVQIERLQYGLTDLLTELEPPTTLREAVHESEAEFLLVTAGTMADERHAARHIASAAPQRVHIWNVEGSGHTRGLATDPAGWERTVVGFLDRHLGDR